MGLEPLQALQAQAAAAAAEVRRLDQEILEAKAAAQARPKNTSRASKYDEIKKAYKFALQHSTAAKQAYQEALQSGGKKAIKGEKKVKIGGTWSCELCSISIPVEAADSVEVHLNGKRHLKLLGINKRGKGPKEGREEAAPMEGQKKKRKARLAGLSAEEKEQLKWTCHVCGVTIAASAQAAHEAGKKHTLKLEEQRENRLKFEQTSKLGDWLCRCGTHNFAKKTRCVSDQCRLSKEAGDTELPAGTVLKAEPLAWSKFRKNSKPGDWLCKCGQHNFARFTVCTKEKCQLARGEGDMLMKGGDHDAMPGGTSPAADTKNKRKRERRQGELGDATQQLKLPSRKQSLWIGEQDMADEGTEEDDDDDDEEEDEEDEEDNEEYWKSIMQKRRELESPAQIQASDKQREKQQRRRQKRARAEEGSGDEEEARGAIAIAKAVAAGAREEKERQSAEREAIEAKKKLKKELSARRSFQ